MKRHLERLSAREVETKKRAGYWADGGGLYLAVSASRAKGRACTRSWIFRYTLKGKAREMGLGSLNALSLAEARQKARECRRQLLEHIDPIDARDAQRQQVALTKAKDKPVTFTRCAEAYIKANRAGWKNAKHAEQWQATLDTYAVPILGELSVRDIDTALVLQVLEPIWTTKLETAMRLRGRIERVLDFARVKGHRSGENPARWRGHLEQTLAKPRHVRKAQPVEHHAALPYTGINAFVEALRRQPGVAARALEFTILTAARTGEALGAKPEEIDVDKGIWTIPASRMKAGIEHRVPLSPRALAIVKAQPEGEYLFQGMRPGTGLSNMAMLAALRRMGRGELTVHGFRSTFRDWAAECTNFPHKLCEAALAHAIGANKAEEAYLRSKMVEKRRPLMLQWARFCDTPAGRGRVIPLGRRESGAQARP